jgi:glycosyltransferase involved in cell wall biosynthesis
MSRKKAIWASSQHWRAASQVSAHHYARLLVQAGWDVAFLAHPISPWHLLRRSSRPSVGDRWRSWRQGGERDLDGRLLHYVPLTLAPPRHLPLLRRRAVLDHWARLTVPSLRRFLRRHGFRQVDLLVIDSPLYGFLLGDAAHSKSVLRIVDDLAGFPGVAPSWVQREQELIAEVDHVIVTGRVLEQKVLPYRPRALTCVPNGVQVEHFLNGTAALPPEYRAIPAPRAVYVGAVEEWLDVPLLADLARQLPGVSFVLIGDGQADLGPLRGRANMHILGRRPYAQVPAYLKHAAVGLIPFKQNRLVRAVNPIKLYEYMACGLNVVATAWEELEHLASPARLCRGVPEFRAAIAAAIEESTDKEMLIDFARRADWRERARLLFRAIGVA